MSERPLKRFSQRRRDWIFSVREITFGEDGDAYYHASCQVNNAGRLANDYLLSSSGIELSVVVKYSTIWGWAAPNLICFQSYRAFCLYKHASSLNEGDHNFAWG